MNNDLPFEITPQVIRTLNEIMNFAEGFYAVEPIDPEESCIIEYYEPGEKATYKSEISRLDFFTYLEEINAIKIIGQSKQFDKIKSYGGMTMLVPSTFELKILDIEAIKQLVDIIKYKDEKLKENEQSEKILKKIEFSNNKATIKINGSVVCQLPPDGSEHILCKIVFYSDDPISWDECYEYMEDNETNTDTPEARKKIYDTVRRVNKRIKNIYKTSNNLFIWQSGVIVKGSTYKIIIK